MNNNRQTLELRGDRELVLTRRFAAPRRLVWLAYSDCEHLKRWWGPRGWELTHCRLDFRPGGVWHYCMSGEYEGKTIDSWGIATYQQIDNPDRFVYEDAFSDEDGNVQTELPLMTITVTLTEEGDETLLTSHTLFESAAARQQVIDMGMEEGIRQTWDRLDQYLPALALAA